MLRTALFYSFSTNYFSMGIQLISVMVIARLLTPEEMGVYSIAASLIILAQVFRDFGVGQYIIQEKDLTTDRIRAAFSLTLISGWSLATAIYFLAPYIGDFYDSDGIATILRILAINFWLMPFGATTMAYLRREMNFKARMYVNGVASIVRATTSITCAFEGLSYLSLAYGSLAEAITIVLVSRIMRPTHLPRAPGFRELGHVFMTGWKLALNTFMGFLSANITELMLGKLISLEQVGIFSRARATINIFDNLITSSTKAVALPYFATTHRDGEDVAGKFIRATTLITVFSWPFFAFVAFFSLPILRTLYGDQWDHAAPIVSVFCVIGMMSFISYFFDSFLVAVGKPGSMIKAQLVLIPVRVAVIFLMYERGLVAIAYGMAILPVLKFVMLWPAIRQTFELGLGDFLFAQIGSLTITLFVVIGCFGAIHYQFLPETMDHWDLLFMLFVSLAIWGGGLFLVRHPLAAEIVSAIKLKSA
jgi:O-antigen/teichoic acid export membrane protein